MTQEPCKPLLRGTNWHTPFFAKKKKKRVESGGWDVRAFLSVVTSNRYESLVEENHTITESSPTGTQESISQPSNQPTTTSRSTPTEM